MFFAPNSKEFELDLCFLLPILFPDGREARRSGFLPFPMAWGFWKGITVRIGPDHQDGKCKSYNVPYQLTTLHEHDEGDDGDEEVNLVA